MRTHPHDFAMLFYADLHVGDRSNGRSYLDMIEAERFITQLAIERKVDWVVFGGDAFKLRNPHDEHKTAWLKVRAERRNLFAAQGIEEADVVGNHCRWYKAENSGHVFEAMKSADGGSRGIIADKCGTWVCTDTRVVFHCLPAQTEYEEGLWHPHPDAINICVFHGMVKGCALNQAGTVKADHGAPMEILDRPEFDFVAMGDIHLPQMLDFKHTRGGYVGSTLQLDATDAGEQRGVLIVRFVRGASEPEVEFVPVPQAELKFFVWDASTSLPDLESFRGHLVTLRVKNSSALSSIEFDAEVAKVRGVAKHLSVITEPSDVGRATLAGNAVFGTPQEDFGVYLQAVPNLDEARRARLLTIMDNEVLNGVN